MRSFVLPPVPTLWGTPQSGEKEGTK
jgi:hypothetical protein